MTWFSIFAVYFVIWWITLFAVLPLGMRTQAEDNHVVPGTVESAPTRFRGWRVVIITSVLAAVIHIGWYVLADRFGLDFDAIPRFAPKFY
ncbi:Predicted secreted protein [Rhizobium sp. RU20A]|uniref:DUF1467 family protein n=1 Tax=Rhizobium sp. RU20A TaxID=1907412 RepID=UPI0009553843|nr:DUF1467 family protein [Rhizobium sp. RU20A]SIP97643.1 Predicted secreted protein [Rhizobium sp. RU20A]